MTRFLGDQNSVYGMHESGTYASQLAGSYFWLGLVQSHTVDDSEGLIEGRFLGTLDRSFNAYYQGPRDVKGTLVYNPQDMRLVFWNIGSVQSISGPVARAIVSEINSNVRQNAYTSGTLNPPFSFTIEDSKISPGVASQNFTRTIFGAVPNVVTLRATQGNKIEVSLDYIGQTLTESGATPGSIAVKTNTPYLWNNVSITLGGSPVDTAKEIELVINQNRTFPHYLNGSRDVSVPYQGNRDYTVNLTLDLDSLYADRIYRQFYKGGSTFNMTIDLNADQATVGSQHASFILSGCYILQTPGIPSPFEGVNEATFTIRPKNITGSEWNSFITSGLMGPY